MRIKCVVACRDANGVPTLVPYVVETDQEGYDNGDHYESAAAAAADDGYEDAALVYDENDGPAFLFAHLFPTATAATE